ncbi:MAG: hypothetical protein GC208_01335 [Alphaproteobacteria bacterium]|nr:hypothetical protein [Alphaproteobacteria bacterium]
MKKHHVVALVAGIVAAAGFVAFNFNQPGIMATLFFGSLLGLFTFVGVLMAQIQAGAGEDEAED